MDGSTASSSSQQPPTNLKFFVPWGRWDDQVEYLEMILMAERGNVEEDWIMLAHEIADNPLVPDQIIYEFVRACTFESAHDTFWFGLRRTSFAKIRRRWPSPPHKYTSLRLVYVAITAARHVGRLREDVVELRGIRGLPAIAYDDLKRLCDEEAFIESLERGTSEGLPPIAEFPDDRRPIIDLTIDVPASTLGATVSTEPTAEPVMGKSSIVVDAGCVDERAQDLPTFVTKVGKLVHERPSKKQRRLAKRRRNGRERH